MTGAGETPVDYVFGYGSLARGGIGGSPAPGRRPCRLNGYRRAWTVAMDNGLTLPGYKYYVDPRDGSRPALFVTFLNLSPAEGHAVNGTAFAVTAAEIALLDDRERNYERIEVTGMLSEPIGGRVWSYIGTRAARERFEEGRRLGRAAVSTRYIEDVRSSFRSAGDAALREFDASTDPPACPIADLRRVDVGR